MKELPAGWAWATLPELIGVEGVFSDGDWVESKDQDPDGEVRLTQLADIGDGTWRNRSNRHMTRDAAERLDCTSLQAGDVLVARMPDPLGRACIFPGDPSMCVTAVDVCIVRPDPQAADPRWLMWWLNTPHLRAEVVARQAGTTRKRISRKNLGGIPFPIPPFAEQRRIVAAVEEQLSRLEAARTTLDRANTRSFGLERAAIEGAFSKEWPRRPLGEIAEIVGGVTRNAARETDPDYVEVPYLRVANVQRGYLDLETVATVRTSSANAAALELRCGDVLFNEGGDRDKLGRGWVWSGEIDRCIHQNHVFRARLNGDFDPRFVSWWGNSFGRDWFWAHGRQTTNLASISRATLATFPVPAPSLTEQREVVARIERNLGGIARIRAEIGAANRRSLALRRAILATAFRGELVPQDPDDEPASVLLERIAAERAAAPPARRTRRRVPAET